MKKDNKQRLFEMMNKVGGMPINEANRIPMSQFLSRETDNVDTLIQMMSKYTPDDYWLISVGYLNNTYIPVKVKPTPELEKMAGDIGDDYINSLVGSDEWKSGKMKHPHAGRTVKGESIPSTIYKLKRFKCQWLSPDARSKLKGEKDVDIKNAYTAAGQKPIDIDSNDKRGLGWSSIKGTPFEKNDNTGTQAYAMYRKKNCYIDSKPTYFIKLNGKISELSDEQVKFFFQLSKTDNTTKIPRRLAAIEDEKLRNELWRIENLYEFKRIDLSKIPFLNCTCEINGENVKLTYVNKNVAPDGVNQGEFKEFIEKEVNKEENLNEIFGFSEKEKQIKDK